MEGPFLMSGKRRCKSAVSNHLLPLLCCTNNEDLSADVLALCAELGKGGTPVIAAFIGIVGSDVSKDRLACAILLLGQGCRLVRHFQAV